MVSIDTPGLSILRQAHLDLEGLVMDSKVRVIRDRLSQDWSAAIYNGKLSIYIHFGVLLLKETS